MTDRINPLLSDWTDEFSLPPFDAITDADFAPAFEAALASARENIRAIAENPAAPDFANVIEALELAEQDLDRVAGVFYNLAGADSTPAREALQRDLAPKMSAFSSEVTNNKALFARIDAVWTARAGLAAEPLRVLDLYRRMFIRAGAQLEGADAARLTAVKARLAVLGTAFSQNLLADERAWFMPVDEADLEGLPEFVIASARVAGGDKGVDGPVITLNR
jgi:peptidyl-dipeptidase Dcp